MTLTCCKNKNQAKEGKKEAKCDARYFNTIATTMSSLLCSSLPQVRLLYPLLHFLLPSSNQVTLNSGVLFMTAVASISSRMNFRHLFLCSPNLYSVPLMFLVALCCGPHAVNASLSCTCPPPHPSLSRCSSPCPSLQLLQ